MSASAFDLRPQPGEMVVSRSDVKKRRKEGNILEDPLQTSPKRTKVHAQRKFAQGSSNMSSPALTPVKDKVKVNGTVLSPELLPAKRPKTEDFLTFLCFRGTPILPPCLDFFNVATMQETAEEEQSTSVGDTSRENTRNSRLHRSADRNNSEATGSGLSRKADRSDGDGKRRPQTAVQALRRKYHEQRLAKQRASNLKKLVQKVKGKNMVKTRSAALHEEMVAKGKLKASARNAILKKTAQKVNLPQKKIKPAPKPTLKKVPLKSRKGLKIRRDGLRSGGQLPPGSDVGIQSERILRQPDQALPRLKPTVKKKIVPDKNKKTFASSLSDFSSDDDQPLAKKIKVKPKPLERVSGSRQLARKVIKRIVSKRMKPKLRMVTRSREQHKKQQQHEQKQQQQQETDTKESTEARVSTRPTRKTKEAAALYMELLGRKLISAEAEVDEDSLSIDSFPELPNARRNERRENEIKERAIKEKKEAALQAKDNPKTNMGTKQKQSAAVTGPKEKHSEEKAPLKTKKSVVHKQESPKNKEKSKESEPEVKKDLLGSKKKVEGPIIKQKRGAAVPEDTDSPRRSLRTPTVEPQAKKTRDATPPKLLKPTPATLDEEKFSDSDEEPLGKLALKHSNKKLGEQASTSKEESKEQNTDKKEKNFKVDKNEKGQHVEKKDKECKRDKEKEHHNEKNEKEPSPEKKEKESKSVKKEKDQQMSKNEKELQVDKKEKEPESNKKEKNEKMHRAEKKEAKADKKEKGCHVEGNEKEHSIEKQEKECKINKKEKESKTDKKEKESQGDKNEKSMKTEKKEKDVTGRVEKQLPVTKKEDRQVETKQKEKKENEISDKNKEKELSDRSKEKELSDKNKEKELSDKNKEKEVSNKNKDKETTGETKEKQPLGEGEEKLIEKKMIKNEEIKTTPRNLGRKQKQILNIKDRPILKIPVVKPSAAAKKKVLPKEKKKKLVRPIGTNKPKALVRTTKSKTANKTENLESSEKSAEDDSKDADASPSRKPEVFKRHSERLLDTYKTKEENRRTSDRLCELNKKSEAVDISKVAKTEVKNQPDQVANEPENKQCVELETNTDNLKTAGQTPSPNKNREANKKTVQQIVDSNQTSPVPPKKKKEDMQSVDQTDDNKSSDTQKEISSSKSKGTPQKVKNEDDKKDSKLLDTEKKKSTATKRKSTSDDQLCKTSGVESVFEPEFKVQKTSSTNETPVDAKSPKTPTVKAPSVAQSSSEAHAESLSTKKVIDASTVTNIAKAPKPNTASSQGKPEENKAELPKINNSKPSTSAHAIKQPETSKSCPMKPPDVKTSESNVVNQTELMPPSFRDKNKVNMSNEQIEKWIHDSCLQHSTVQKRLAASESFRDENIAGGSDKSLAVVKPGPIMNVKTDDIKEKSPEPPKDLGIKRLQQPEGAVSTLQSAVKKLALLEEKRNVPDDIPQLHTPCVSAKSSPAKSLQGSVSGISSPDKTHLLDESRMEESKKQDSGTVRQQQHQGEKKSIFQQRRSFPLKAKERKDLTPSANAFSPENESSVYAFETEPELPPISTPFRRKARDSRTSSTATSKSEEDLAKLEDEATSPPSVQQQMSPHTPSTLPPPPVSKPVTEEPVPTTSKSTSTSSASIAVQVNLDNEPETPTQVVLEPQIQEPLPQRSMECSTQTDVAEDEEDESEGHLFYIPLQQPPSAAGSSLGTPIQGVAVKLGTEGPTGPNQRVIMRAKLVTKPPNFNRVGAPGVQDGNALGMNRSVAPRPAGVMEPKTSATTTYPPVGTVQPTARGRPLGTESQYTKKPLAMVTAKPIVSSLTSRDTPSTIKDVDTNCPSTSKVVASSASSTTATATVATTCTFTTTATTTTTKRGSQKSKHQRSTESTYICTPSNSTRFPSLSSTPQMVEAPTFHPTEKEFQDPLEFIDRIRPVAEKFGLCRVVPPPNFKPECKVTDDMRFLAYNQYVHKMLHRWGPNVKEMMAIKKYLATQSISLIHPPWIGGMEVDLPRLYKIVQTLGGLKEVIEKKKWQRVADGMKIPKSAQDRVTKLDDIYCKYLLPYDTLSPAERQKLFEEVEKEWNEKEKKQNASSSDSTDDDDADNETTDENEECIVKGRNMPLNAFYRIARNTMSMWFRQPEPPAAEVEQEFWRHVTSRQSHVCVHSGSIDSSGWGYGFPVSKNSPFARHPWNLKVLTNNSGSILRSMGPIMGVTVPTLHVGMLFTTCCWYRDPHGLPWVEYLHTGASKIWYGIPDEYSAAFRSALTKLVPRYCKNKTIWLPSDTAMVPPPMLVKHGVSLCHTVQDPGQFIIVFPKAFTSSICTGYLVSESVYFAQPSWLATAEQVFKDIRDSCEPSMFSLERLLFSIAMDTRSHIEVLKQVLPMVVKIRQQELDYRKQLYALGLKTSERLPLPEANPKRKKARQAREEEGDYECEMCRANLFVSLVTNSHEEGVYCLPHAIELLIKKRHHLKYCKLMYTYDQAELNELVQKLEERIEAKSHKKSQSKHATNSALQKP